jgi:hypothetical protein
MAERYTEEERLEEFFGKLMYMIPHPKLVHVSGIK